MTDTTELAIARKYRDQTAGLGLFDAATGPELKAEGMQQARDASDVQAWKARFTRAVEQLAERGEPFTSEDVTALCGLPRESQQNRNAAVGAMMSGMATKGVIRKTGRRVQSKLPRSHAREILEWVGVDATGNL